jgi:glycerol-3-phosphate acyltransferase PlsY
VLILAAIWLFFFGISRFASLASIVAAAALPLITLLGSWLHGKIQNGTWNKPLFGFSILIAVLAIWKHRSNIQRLMDGTEHRFNRKPKSTDG